MASQTTQPATNKLLYCALLLFDRNYRCNVSPLEQTRRRRLPVTQSVGQTRRIKKTKKKNNNSTQLIDGSNPREICCCCYYCVTTTTTTTTQFNSTYALNFIRLCSVRPGVCFVHLFLWPIQIWRQNKPLAATFGVGGVPRETLRNNKSNSLSLSLSLSVSRLSATHGQTHGHLPVCLRLLTIDVNSANWQANVANAQQQTNRTLTLLSPKFLPFDCAAMRLSVELFQTSSSSRKLNLV